MDPNTSATATAQLAEDIEALRAQFPDTQDVYREVCALLFFRYGVTPTANKLYQLVRKGSMSAPAQALASFWENLRQKSRVRIEHPDLPAALAPLAGELVGTLWQRAREAAEQALQEAQAAARASVTQAEALAAAEGARAEAAAQALFQLRSEFSAALTRLQDAEHALAREQGLLEAQERQLASAVGQRRELQEALAAARRTFEEQLAEERSGARAAAARHMAEVQGLVGEVERERSRAAGALRDLAEARSAAQTQAADLQALQSELFRLQQSLGLAQGTVAELRAARNLLQQQLERAARSGRATASARPRGRILTMKIGGNPGSTGGGIEEAG